MSALQQVLLCGGGESDPDFASVVFLINFMNLADGVTAFTDESSYAQSVSRLGNITTSGGALVCDRSDSANGLSIAGGSWRDFGTGDFTWEVIVQRVGSGGGLFGSSNSSSYLGHNSSFGDFDASFPTGTGRYGPSWGTSKIHVGVMRESGTIRLLYNGSTYINSNTNSELSINMTNDFYLGRYSASNTALIANIYSVRITKGVARYVVSSNTYTPPDISKAFPSH